MLTFDQKEPRYCYVALRSKMEPSIRVRLSRRGLKALCDLEKWNTLVFHVLL